MKSWKTTFLGVATIVMSLLGATVALLDGDPKTNVDITMLIAALTAGWGLIMAKDSGITGV